MTLTVTAAAKMFVFLHVSPGFVEEGMVSMFLHKMAEAIPLDEGVQLILPFFEEGNAFLKDAADIVHFHSQHFIHVSLLHALLADQIHHPIAFTKSGCFCQQRILTHQHHNLEEMPRTLRSHGPKSACMEEQPGRPTPRPSRFFLEAQLLHYSNQKAVCCSSVL